MITRRRLLFLSPIIPAQRGNGLAMRTCFFLEAYARHFDVDLAALPIIAAPEKITDFVRACVSRLQVFPRPPTDAHFSLVAATIDPTARLSAFLRYGCPSLASRAGAPAQQMLENWVKNEHYDVVHVERLYLSPLIERWMSRLSARPRLVIDCDDDDAAAYRQLAAIERRDGRAEAAAWAEAEAAAFGAMAQKVLRRFDLAFAASSIASGSLSVHGTQVTVVPNVVPIGRTPVSPRIMSGCKVILFVGTMGYAPNDDAARWFLTRVWPRLRRLFRTPVRLMIVGSDPSARLVRLAQRPDVVVTGTVAKTAPFYRIADLAVIPVRAGSGIRIKLLEAAANGVPVVSTTAGAEGTTFRHGRELLLADTEERFARACADLLQDRPRALRLARQARATIVLDYDAGRWNRRIGDLAARVLGTSRRASDVEYYGASARPRSP
jgi:polysaccharide biosynthesis protein PslH